MKFTRRQFVTTGTIAVLAPSIATVTALAAPPKGIPADATEATFVDAVDGEKIKVTIAGEDHEVRLIGVDAPELKNDDDLPECYFAESTSALKDMLAGQTLYLESDVEDNDSKDRLWRFVWIGGTIVPTLVNDQLLRDGTVILRTEEKNTKYQDRLQKAAKSAQTDGTGLWGSCGGGHVAVTPVPRHGSKEDPGLLGEALTANGVEVTLASAYTAYSYGYSSPKGGYVYLICEAVIRNIDTDDHGYSDGRFGAIDNDTKANFDSAGSATDQGMGSGDLSPAEYVDGIIAVEIQETATNLLVKYGVQAFGGDTLYWLVSL
jgi:endonuclease YncB( thermonuclease family)